MKQESFNPSQFYHIFNRGNNKENIFISEANYSYFLKLIKKYLLPVCDIYAYCLLPNHFHFIIRIKDNDELPENIKNGERKLHQPFSNLFNAYTKAINKKHNRIGSLFQEHLKRIKIDNELYLQNLIVYVHTNPSHHSISNFENYLHSSYKSIISSKTTLLKRDEVLILFDDVENFKVVHSIKKKYIEALNKYLME